MKNALTPRKIISINGKVHYSESNQAWNLLKFKSEFLNEFPQLKEKRSKFSYKIVYHRDFTTFEEFLKEIKKTSIKAIPILMWLYREEDKV